MSNNLTVIGIGRLGLCFALTLEKSGYNVVGVDIVQEYVDLINTKRLRSPEPGVEEYLKSSQNFQATTSLEEAVSHSNDLFIVVATPSLPSGKYDHSQVNSIISQLEKLGKASCRKNFIVCCTVMPGYCDSIKDRLDKLNYTVSYNPEFIAQGCILHNQANPDMVLIGEGSPEAGKRLEEIYHKICKNLPAYCRMKPKSAEITKIALNCFITMKIAYANTVGDIATLAGAEPEKILEAIGSDRRVGNAYFKYGYGFGGPCFGRDQRALGIFALENSGYNIKLAKATDEANKYHLNVQLSIYMENNPDKTKEVVMNSVTFKPGTIIIEESQQLLFAVGLARSGYKVVIKEGKEVVGQVRTLYGDLFAYETRQ